jgi:hypothetical protein
MVKDVMGTAALVARGMGAAAEAGVKMVAQAVLTPERTRSSDTDDGRDAVESLEREIADLRQRVALLEGRLAAAQKATPAKQSVPGAGAQNAASKRAAGTKKAASRRPGVRKSAKSTSTPTPIETSGIPDTPATVAERATVTKPAD